MSLFNRKTVLDAGGIESYNVFFGGLDFITDIHQSLPDPLDLWGGQADQAAQAATDAARLSADATLQSTEKNIDFQKWLWGEQKDLLSPYASAGTKYLGQYDELKDQPIDMYEDPSYQFGLNEGQKAVENSASARGMSLSGAQLKKLNRYGQDYGTTKYNEAFNRRQNNLDNLYRMITMGGNAAAGQANTGTTAGNQISSSINTAGNAMSGMYQDIGNITAANLQGQTNRNMDIAKTGATIFAMSDDRLKENITKIGVENGFNIYSWTWNKLAKQFGLIGDSYGVIAQEVMKTKPNAVITDSGYLKVNYSLLGVNHGS